MENINIKDYIINNFKEDNKETLERAINESIAENDEVTLPGLGVFFTLFWPKANTNLKQEVLDILEKEIKN